MGMFAHKRRKAAEKAALTVATKKEIEKPVVVFEAATVEEDTAPVVTEEPVKRQRQRKTKR